MKIDFKNLSKKRKIILTIGGILYAINLMGTFMPTLGEILLYTLVFLAIVGILFLWIK